LVGLLIKGKGAQMSKSARNLRKLMQTKEYWANHSEGLSSLEYRSQINPFVVAYTQNLKTAEDKQEGVAPTNYLNIPITPLPLPTNDGDKDDKEEKTFREAIGDREYNQINPSFTAEVCQALARKNCKHCYNSGVQHYSVPEKVKWAEACWCVKNKLKRMEKEQPGTMRAILAY
jgi:hypothetical protein